MSIRASIAAVISMMVNAVVFGIGAIAVLSIPQLNAQASYLLPIVIVMSFLISPFIAWQIAPCCARAGSVATSARRDEMARCGPVRGVKPAPLPAPPALHRRMYG